MEISSNSLNPSKGRDFQIKAANLLGSYFNVNFRTDYPISIGKPPKQHKFDLVSENMNYVGESKNISWTVSGNVPSAKMAFMNEAVFYLQQLPLPGDTNRFVVVRKDKCANRAESLGEYYFRINHHLLNGVFILEIDLVTENIQRVGA